jgi:PAS domain S-box-containing protein
VSSDTINGPEANAHLAAIVDSSDDAIVSKTLEGFITSWNQAAERIFGYTRDEAVGRHISLIIPSERLDEEFIILGKVKSGQRVDHFETVRRAKDGTLIDLALTVSPIRDDAGEIIGASKIARDIRALKEAERQSAYLASIINSSDDAIVSKNLNGIITSWNAAAEKMFGYIADEAVGQHITLVIPPERIDEEFAIIGKIRSGEKVDHFETQRRSKTGDIIDVSLTVSPIVDRGGTIIGASKIARNITEQRRLVESLKQGNRRKDEFLANMSHELRTPLNAIIGLSHLLSLEPLSPKGQKFVAMIKQGGDNLLAMVNDLLDLSKSEAKALHLDPIPFSLVEAVQEVAGLHHEGAKAKGLELKLTFRGALRQGYLADPLRVKQVVTNLLGNALKFTEKGAITLSVALVSEGERHSIVSIEVADTGIGIAPDVLPTIFDKFIQGDASTARTHGGTGLGLSITKALVEAMSGTISVDSTPGLGSTFTVDLKLEHTDNDSRIATDVNRDNYDILVVEDLEPNVIVLTYMLDDLGYTYYVAPNGMEAIRAMEEHAFRAVLMDIQMPGMDDYEATRRLRELERQRGAVRTPIIAVTAHAMQRDRERALKAGMDDFMSKPFKPEQLQQTLHRFVEPERAV